MINKQKISKAWRWKVAILPLLVLLLMAFSKTRENSPPSNEDYSSEIHKKLPLLSIEVRSDGNYVNNKLCSLEDLLNKKKAYESYNPDNKYEIRFITQNGVSISASRFIEIYDILGRQNPNILMIMMNNAEHQAEFLGGPEAMFSWLAKNVKYHKSTQAKLIDGVVLVHFSVSNKGKIENCTLLSYSDSELNAEALRVVSAMPTWKPAIKNGLPIAVDYTVPIAFRIK